MLVDCCLLVCMFNCCVLFVVGWLLFVVCCLLLVCLRDRLSFVVRCLMRVVWCLFFAVQFLCFVVCGSLCIVLVVV